MQSIVKLRSTYVAPGKVALTRNYEASVFDTRFFTKLDTKLDTSMGFPRFHGHILLAHCSFLNCTGLM